ncbi:MAG: 4Fe-4S binding protein [Bacteroidota bacterium]
MGLFSYLSGIYKGIRSLLRGMSVTGHYFFHPGEIVTQQYPENRKTLKMYPSFKGEVIMPHNANNEHKCTGCGICEMNCPNGSIEVISKQVVNEEGKKKRLIDMHIYHLDMCTFCELCIKTCPSDALAWGQTFEHAVFDRSRLTKVLNKPDSKLMEGVE